MPVNSTRTGIKLLTLLAITTLLWGCDKAQSEPVNDVTTPVKLFDVPKLKHSQEYQFVAQVSASKQAQLTFQVPGEIDILKVRMGEDVSQGQLLARLDQHDYLLALKAREAEFALQKARLNRANQLFKKHLISEDSLDQTQTAYTEAQLNLQQAQTDLSYTELLAPFDGVVSITHAKTFQFVEAKQPIISTLNNQNLDIDFTLPIHITAELDIESLRKSKLNVRLSRFDSLLIPATFKEISTKPDADTNSYKVTLTIARPAELNILPGMSGTVHIENALTEDKGFFVPDGAVFSREGVQAQIWKMDRTTQSLEAVSIELNSDNKYISGLNAGDRIVIAGAKNLQQGQKVRPWVKEGGI
jgi:RND family efflux transporter MFP subunit